MSLHSRIASEQGFFSQSKLFQFCGIFNIVYEDVDKQVE